MRYTHSINAVKCQEWGLNLAQGALMDLLNQASGWAEPQVVGGQVYYWVSRNKIVSEIPVAYSKPDTVYRSLKLIAEKGLIDHIKDGKKDLMRLTDKGKTWNVKGTEQGDAKLGNKSELPKKTEINPNKLGNKSENHSEINPTYKNTNTNKSISNKNTKASKYKPVKPESVSEQVWNDLLILRKETKASNTKTAWTPIYSGLEKAQQATGHSLDQIITFWIGKAWKGFNADWYLNAQPKPQQTNYQGNNHAAHQSANHSNQPNHFDSLRAEIAAKYGTSEQPRDIRTVSETFGDDDRYV